MSPTLAAGSVRYVVDRDDRIIAIGPNPEESAEHRAPPGFPSGALLNRSLWEIVTGRDDLALFKMLLRLVRHSGHRVTVPFGCTSTTMKRQMVLEISLLADGKVEFVSRTDGRGASRGLALLDASSPGSIELLTICGWCKRVRTAPRTWVETGDVVLAFEPLRRTDAPRLSHGICEACRSSVLQRARPTGKRPTQTPPSLQGPGEHLSMLGPRSDAARGTPSVPAFSEPPEVAL
jgi:hypothetical protein